MDYSTQIRQLSEARRDTIKSREDLEVASAKDGVDRGHSIALLKRDVAKYDQQLVDIEAAIAKESPPPAPPAKKEKSASK